MRRSYSDSQMRITIAALCDGEGYVDTLLEVARERSLARQAPPAIRLSPRAHEAAPPAPSAHRREWH